MIANNKTQKPREQVVPPLPFQLSSSMLPSSFHSTYEVGGGRFPFKQKYKENTEERKNKTKHTQKQTHKKREQQDIESKNSSLNCCRFSRSSSSVSSFFSSTTVGVSLLLLFLSPSSSLSSSVDIAVGVDGAGLFAILSSTRGGKICVSIHFFRPPTIHLSSPFYPSISFY